jgi:hypothetical protein
VTIKSITKTSEENDQLMPKHISSVRYPILQDEHIQWLAGRPHVYAYITVESLHHELNEVFQFPHPVSINCVSKAIWSQIGFNLKLMCYEPNDFNNEEHHSFTLMLTYKQSVQRWCKVG